MSDAHLLHYIYTAKQTTFASDISQYCLMPATVLHISLESRLRGIHWKRSHQEEGPMEQALIRYPPIQEVLETNLKYRYVMICTWTEQARIRLNMFFLQIDLGTWCTCNHVPWDSRKHFMSHAANFSWATRASVYLACHLSTCIGVDRFWTSIAVQICCIGIWNQIV